jgi:methylglutaconyl-CoA hydratase
MQYLGELQENYAVRAIILTSKGKNFCAGADLKWMQSNTGDLTTGNDPVGQKLAELMSTLHQLSKPTLAWVRGAIYGGGIGLVACCDIALAIRGTRFCFSEVRLGLIPSVISPYVVRAIGERNARRYFLTAETFDANEACRIGLVHQIIDPETEQTEINKITDKLIAGGPCALSRTKELLDQVASAPLDNAIKLKTTEWIAEVRQTPEAREGIEAFFQKRNPSWLKDD